MQNRLKFGKDVTDIIDGTGNKEEIKKKVENIKRKIEEEKDEYEKEKLNERLAKLLDGAAIIRVGAVTETEMKDKKLRIEDAVSGARAAVKEGVVPGGGITYLNVKKKLKKLYNDSIGDEKLGVNVVMEALEIPTKQILINAGEDASVILNKINEMDDEMGYDALNLKFVNMKENGIIDPAKVTKNAILNAASVAGMVITTEAICVEEKSEEKMPHEIM